MNQKNSQKFKKHKKIHDDLPRCNTEGTRTVENNFKIAQINVEGLTRAKADILGKRFGDIDVLVTHKRPTYLMERQAA